MSDLEEFFKEHIKPYEERLKKLEELDKKKDVEILYCVVNIHSHLEDLSSGAVANLCWNLLAFIDFHQQLIRANSRDFTDGWIVEECKLNP